MIFTLLSTEILAGEMPARADLGDGDGRGTRGPKRTQVDAGAARGILLDHSGPLTWIKNVPPLDCTVRTLDGPV